MGLLPATVQADFTAYNDLGGTSSGNVTSISQGSSGTLKNYATGVNTSVTLQVTGSDATTDTSTVVADFTGGDAGAEFGTILNNDGYIRYNASTAASLVTCTFTGLNPAMRYTVVVTGTRGNAPYTTRTTKFSIADADAFTNASSAGAPYSGPDWVEFNTGDNTTPSTSYVAKFIDIQPGSDGDVQILAGPGPHNGDTYKWYISMIKLVETSPPASGTVTITPAQINSVVGAANVNTTVAIPAGSNASNPVSVTLSSNAPAMAQALGSVAGQLTVTFPAGGATQQTVPIVIGTAGSAAITASNTAGLQNATLNVNVAPAVVTFNIPDMLGVVGANVPVRVAITPGSNGGRAVQVTLTSSNAAAAVPVGTTGDSLVVTFAQGGATEQRVNLQMVAAGAATIATTNNGGLGNATLAVTAAPGFTFTSTADPRNYVATWDKVLAAINEYAGGPGAFHVSAGDIDPLQPLRDKIDARFGASAIWVPGVGNHEVETAEDMAWVRAEYNTGNGVRTPLKQFTNQDGPATCKETNFSWDYGNAHFINLNQYWNGTSDVGSDGDIVPALYSWISSNLAANTKPVVIVFGHEPAYPFNRHIGDSLDAHPANRDAFWNLLESYSVPAYIVGHTHVYSRYQKTANKTWQIDLGNAGNASTAPDPQTFLNTTVTDTQVRFDIWRNASDGNPVFQRTESWSVPIGLRMNVNPTSFTRIVDSGGSLTPDNFTVAPSAAGTLNYTISDNATWLSCSTDSGVSTGETDTIAVHYDVAGLLPGTYSAVITVTSPNASNSPQTLSASLTVRLAPDFDHDNDVDGSDLMAFQACLGGPANPYAPTCTLTPDDFGKVAADFDKDNDVDADDFGVLQRCLSGTGGANPNCIR